MDRILIPLFLLSALAAVLAFKKKRKQITASVVSLVFCFLLIELFLRIFSPQINESTGLFETDKILGWRFIPSATGSIVYQGEARHYIKTNSLGFRDDEPEPGKDVIMVLGDSFVANIAVKHDEVFTEVMERELENASVMNFGVSGYAQTQEYLILERFAKQLHPKLVFVVLYVRNDFLDNIGGYWLFPRPKAFIDPNGEVQILIPMDAEDPKRHSMPMLELHRRLHLFHFVQNKWSNIRKGMKKPSGGVHRPAPGTPPELYLCKREFDEATELMFKTTEALIMKMDRFGKGRNLPVVFVIAPTIYQVRQKQWNSYLKTLRLDRDDYDPALPGKRLMKLAEKEGLSMLDLLPPLEQKGSRERNSTFQTSSTGTSTATRSWPGCSSTLWMLARKPRPWTIGSARISAIDNIAFPALSDITPQRNDLMNKKNQTQNQFCGRTRREFLWQAGGGFGGLALSGMLDSEFFGNQAMAADGVTPLISPLAVKKPHFQPKAKSVIFLFMYGGPSQVDTFDHKPKLYPLDGKTVKVKTFGRGGRKSQGRIVGPKWQFQRYGKCGKMVSDLFPNLATCVDDIAFIHSMYAESPIHGSALLMMNAGRILSGHPCIGSWVTYGLGSENQNLPGFVVMLDPKGGPISGAKNWTSGYMPAAYQGVTIRSQGTPILDLNPQQGVTRKMQRRLLDQLNEFNREHSEQRPGNSDLQARIASYELAYNMQRHAPEAVDLNAEAESTREMYGLNNNTTQDFGRKCLLARRLVERGVRFVQIYSGGGHNDDNWDAHRDMMFNHTRHAGRTDKPVAALLKDLKQRGLLEETIVIWGGEFGRQPTAEYAKGTGRDHNSYGFTMWMAGGGIKGGVSHGKTDELGAHAVESRLHVKNLHATVLQQMGLDPNRLSFFFNGLDQKLVGVEAVEPIHQII